MRPKTITAITFIIFVNYMMGIPIYPSSQKLMFMPPCYEMICTHTRPLKDRVKYLSTIHKAVIIIVIFYLDCSDIQIRLCRKHM